MPWSPMRCDGHFGEAFCGLCGKPLVACEPGEVCFGTDFRRIVPEPGSTWRHSKTGGLYVVVVGFAWREGTHEPYIVYREAKTSDPPKPGEPHHFVRPLREWTEITLVPKDPRNPGIVHERSRFVPVPQDPVPQ
jgi:hypothetical protein